MCADLGRWLRTAGYDTAIVDTPSEDRSILEQALSEKRTLLTKDADFFELDPEGKTTVYLKGNSLEEWASQLREEKNLGWLYRPFSRCLECNSPLERTDKVGELPPRVLETTKEFWFCPTCQQLFWHGSHTEHMLATLQIWQKGENILSFGFGGDLMIGRLVNNVLDHHSPAYAWGDLQPLLAKGDLNIVNLETTLTKSNKLRPKVFNFKADPNKIYVLTEAPIHAVNTANNHILDFSEEGLLETLKTLDKARIPHVGAGSNLASAEEPLILEKKGLKIGLLGCTDNEPTWEAKKDRPGVYYVEIGNLKTLKKTITALREKVDLLILSIHWGPNMRREPTRLFRNFAHALIDIGVDILHGHSAHVFQGVEVYKGKLILYDTGDLVDDYVVDPVLRNDLSFWFVVKAKKNQLLSLEMIPTAISDCQVNLFHGHESLEAMKALCQKLGTSPKEVRGRLFLSLMP